MSVNTSNSNINNNNNIKVKNNNNDNNCLKIILDTKLYKRVNNWNLTQKSYEKFMKINQNTINNKRKHYSGHVNNIPIHTFFKNYQEPEINEGFKEIVHVNFVPGPFENEEDKKIFYYLS